MNPSTKRILLILLAVIFFISTTTSIYVLLFNNNTKYAEALPGALEQRVAGPVTTKTTTSTTTTPTVPIPSAKKVFLPSSSNSSDTDSDSTATSSNGSSSTTATGTQTGTTVQVDSTTTSPSVSSADSDTDTETDSSSEPVNPVTLPTDRMVGLVNHGQTCFANSIFQLLFHSAHFRTAFSAYLAGLPVKKEQKDVADVAQALGAIFIAMDKTNNFGAFKPETFPALQLEFRNNAQYDSFDVLAYYSNFSGFDWSAFALKQRNYNVFNGEVQTSQSPHSIIPNLQLSFPEITAPTCVSELVKHYFSPAPRDLVDWEAQVGIISAAILPKILALPETIIVQAKRFYQKWGSPSVKIVSAIQFETELDFSEYLDDDFEGDRNATKYELVGFIEHRGKTLKSGHFLSFFKRSNGSWVEINDTRVEVKTIQDLKKEFASGYMFMYNRIEPKEY